MCWMPWLLDGSDAIAKNASTIHTGAAVASSGWSRKHLGSVLEKGFERIGGLMDASEGIMMLSWASKRAVGYWDSAQLINRVM